MSQCRSLSRTDRKLASREIGGDWGFAILFYEPPITDASLVAEYRLESEYRGLLFIHPPADLQHRRIKYLYTLAVEPVEGEEAVLYVTSEYNRVSGGGSHVLGLFTEVGHEHHGASDEWADRERFTDRAFDLVCDRLGIVRVEVTLLG